MAAVSAREVRNAASPPLDAPLNPQEDTSADMATAAVYRREFILLSVTFSLVCATVTTPILFASSVLTNEAGQGANAMLYGVCLVSSLFFANLMYSCLGPKRGLSLSMFLYSFYVLSFAYAASLCTERNAKNGVCIKAGALQMPAVLIGAALGGWGAGLLWTCQGAFVTQVCERIAAAEQKELSTVTAQVMGVWGLIFLSTECAVRACTTILHKYLELSFPVTFSIWAALAFLSTLTFTTFASNLQSQTPVQAGAVWQKLGAAVGLWTDPNLWLLQCTNITFGFAASYLGGYVGRTIFSKALSASFLGFAGAMLSGIAAILSYVFGQAASKIGKGPILTCGALAFLALGVCSKWVGPEDPADWGWGALIFYVFMGIGRAVYESTNKGIFSDFFPGPKSPGAFANVFVFNSGSGCVAFVLGASSESGAELYFLLAFGALTVPGYLIACLLRRKAESEECSQLP